MVKGLGPAYYNLSTLLDAGVPLLRSLRTVGAGLKGPLQQAFEQLTQAISKGTPLAEAMGMRPGVFVRLDIMIIHAAETSGNLGEALGLLAKWYEFSQRVRRRILAGLALPIVLIHLTALIAPFPAFVVGGWYIGPYIFSVLGILSLFYVPAAIIVAIMRFTPPSGPARKTLDQVSLRIPVLGKALYKLALSRYSWVFHMLSKAGVPIIEGTEIAVSCTGNAVVADLFRPASASVRAGNLFSEGLSTKLPPEFLEPWRIGEETGSLDEVAKRLAEANAEAAEFWFGEFARWLPRVVYFLVCLLMVYYILKLAAIAMTGVSGLR